MLLRHSSHYRNLILAGFLIVSVTVVYGMGQYSQIPDSPNNTNQVYKKNIKTVRLFKIGIELSDPVISLNSNDQLHLEFDDLNGNIVRYQYTFIHCDADWQTSDIWSNEYLQGDQEGFIDSYNFSFSTIQLYTHYSLEFPNERIQIVLSGNYILKVYTKDRKGVPDLAFTRRFMVFDQKVSINPVVGRATILNQMNTRQEVNFTVTSSGQLLVDPNRNVHVTIQQNGRWDNALMTLKPFMISGNLLDYRHVDGSNSFDGGNEFRHFDTKSVMRISEKMKRITRTDSGYVADLWEFPPRLFKPYTYEDDINGNFVIRNTDYGDDNLRSEYVWVHFVFPFSAPSPLGDFYVAGNFNAWQYTPENKMQYNFNSKSYEAWIYLKQGYYDYQFSLVAKNSNKGDATFIDGSHYETGNNYSIFVYYRDPGTVYDQLIGYNSKNS
jgi:hypothetical protein